MTSAAGHTAVVVGASGGLGQALFRNLQQDPRYSAVLAVSRSAPAIDPQHWYQADTTCAAELNAAVASIESEHAAVHLLIICTGTLQDGGAVSPEKSLRELDSRSLGRLVHVNAFAPLAALDAFSDLLNGAEGARVVVLSAMVGSITDNRLGGWYSYRMSKAALNMGVRTAAIELGRRKGAPILVAMHPGTTLTRLSEPFLSNHSYRDPETSAEHILRVTQALVDADSGKFLNWDGSELPW
jgi:NAD(P)-dependent dehydrogenase (short-subunit alcohol dehydrogenase family)